MSLHLCPYVIFLDLNIWLGWGGRVVVYFETLLLPEVTNENKYLLMSCQLGHVLLIWLLRSKYFYCILIDRAYGMTFIVGINNLNFEKCKAHDITQVSHITSVACRSSVWEKKNNFFKLKSKIILRDLDQRSSLKTPVDDL